MIPLRVQSDSVRDPVVTRSLLLVLLGVFAGQLFLPRFGEALIMTFGFMPARLLHPELFGYSLLASIFTIFTSQFLHGGFVHLAGNLVYLWVFGSGVERMIGPRAFLILYVAGGVSGSLLHAVVFPTSSLPSIGASGCIAALLGAYLALAPMRPIVTLIPLIVSWIIVEVPGLVLMPIWFAMQFLNGWFSLQAARQTEEIGGIAWWAHVGGFGFGLILGAALRSRIRDHAPEEQRQKAEGRRQK
jgi:membrane associated rhomboid family serine protease